MADQQLGSKTYVSTYQLGVLLYNAGFRGSALATMIAISSGCENPAGNVGLVNNNPSTMDYSVGLFQINYFGDLAKSRTSSYGSPKSLANSAQSQADAAYKISGSGTSFSPWAEVGSRQSCYVAALPKATAVAAAVTAMSPARRTSTISKLSKTQQEGLSGGRGDDSGSTGSSSDSSSDCLVHLPHIGPIGGGCLFKKSWGRSLVGGVTILGGGVLIGLSVVLMANSMGLKPKGTATATKAVPAGWRETPVQRRSTGRSKYMASPNDIADRQWYEDLNAQLDADANTPPAPTHTAADLRKRRRVYERKVDATRSTSEEASF